jgi:Leucine-rich repeat (LRR) protein
MRRIIILALLCCLTLPNLAQENSQTPYEIALQRIQEAEANGATHLDLSNLGLTELPPEIGNLTGLQSLALMSNQLSSLPPEFGNLTGLYELSLNDNQLSSLPPEFGNLSNLCFLDIQENRFESIPLELHALKQLGNFEACARVTYAALYLDKQLLDSLPEAVQQGGTPAILDYLENEAWWHLQRLIVGGASSLGLVAAFFLGLRWRQRGKGKKKHA